jgi:alpha-galactosidase
MPKITFIGAGSTVFAKNILGDSMCTPALQDSEIALYDIDQTRLSESAAVMRALNKKINGGRAKIKTYWGTGQRRKALTGSDFVVNAIQVGGYDPATITDFEIPKKYGLRQTIADTIGIGGIFRVLRTFPVMLDFARDMEKVCPDAWLLNYTNPMCALTGGILRQTEIRSVGLCHSVQVCATTLLRNLGMLDDVKDLQWKIAGINHMAWLLEVTDGGKDLYPEIKKRARAKLREWRKGPDKNFDMVRLYMMLNFGYYITESSEHLSEYVPYFIKSQYPHLVEEFNIPLDEYPRRCVNQIARWKDQKKTLRGDTLTHKRTHEYGSHIMEAITTGNPIVIGGNVLNNGLITNLPSKACVEVSCLVDKNGVQGTYVGDLPEQCAALNRTNINTQLLTLEAAFTHKKEHIYHAALLDPHTSAELSIDDTRKLCDELIKAHGKLLPKFK